MKIGLPQRMPTHALVARGVLAAFLSIVGQARAEQPKSEPDKEPIIVSGGKRHVRQVDAEGAGYRVEMQFFQTKHPGECWNGVGRDKQGNIYFGNSTHASNSYLYRLNAKTGQMRYLGDLHSNIRYGGRGGSDNGKIHSSFFEGPEGGVYFLSHYGYIGNIRYGGHLWKYDPRSDRIIDMGVPVPGNTCFCLSRFDPGSRYTYMCSTPGGFFVRYDLQTQEFTVLEQTRMNWARHLPVDNEGNLYVVWGNRIRRFDPKLGSWQTIVEHSDPDPDRNFGPMNAFCWGPGRRRLYFLNYRKGCLFCWRVGSSKVEPLGRLHPAGKDLSLYSLHANEAGTRLYSIGGSKENLERGFYVYDLTSRKGHKLFAIDDIIEHELAGRVKSPYASVAFTDYGGVTGDDGTMYCGFHAAWRGEDLGGSRRRSVVALLAIRVTEGN